jgi:hypothetical protein
MGEWENAPRDLAVSAPSERIEVPAPKGTYSGASPKKKSPDRSGLLET